MRSNRLKECVLILSIVKLSLMSIIEKVFKYEENEISVIKSKDEIWFGGKDIAKALGYKRPHKVVLDHVDSEDKSSLECLQRGSQIGTPFKDTKNEKKKRFS